MAGNVTDWVWKHSRSVNAGRIVLLAIAHEASRDGDAEMSIGELATKCILGERTVQVAVKELAKSGELHVRHGGGRGHRAQYRVTMGNPADPAPFEPQNPADPAPFRETPQILHPAESAPFKPYRRRSRRNPADPAPIEISDVLNRSTAIPEVQVKEVPAIREDVERLCAHLADRIEANGSKRPTIGAKWRTATRLMLDRDSRTEQQIHAAIDWAQDHEFWRANILSMPKLREKYDQLRLQATRGNGRRTTKDRVRQAAEAGRRAQAMANGSQP